MVPSDLAPRLWEPFRYLLQHPVLGSQLAELASLIDTRAEVVRARADPSRVRDVHCEVKIDRDHGGDWRLDRFYWSLQTSQEGRLGGFEASTLSWAAKTKECCWFGFPEDSYLPGMALWHRDAVEKSPRESISVLRYVPLRRFTFRHRKDGVDVIGKIKRRSRYRQAWSLLDVVSGAVDAARVPFRVSKPLHIDDDRCLYAQSSLNGQDLVGLIDVESASGLPRQVGALHAALHRIPPPPALAERSNVDWLAGVAADAAVIEFLGPETARVLDMIPALLRRSLPRDMPPAFCHGDFVCSQLLVAEDGWAITDFDLCHAGDPYREIAMLLASLPYDVAGQGTTAYSGMAAAYLDGYMAAYGGTLDQRRLCWHRIGAEIYYLALALRKGRYSESMFATGLQTTLDLARQLSAL